MKPTSVATPRAVTARHVAHSVLLRVARDGAFLNRALDTLLERTELPSRDRALATELAYGTLRWERYLDFILQSFAQKPLAQLPIAALQALRLGAYQLLFLRIPPHSAVNETVNLFVGSLKRLRGVANGILRNVERAKTAESLPDPETAHRGSAGVAIRTAQPQWLFEEVVQRRGFAAAEAWALACNQAAPTTLRVIGGEDARQKLRERLAEADIQTTIDAAWPPEALGLTSGATRINRLPGYDEGLFTTQDPAGMLVGRLAAPAEGSTVLDACAAPGGKATHLAEYVGRTGQVLACDVHPGKVGLIAEHAQRLDLPQLSAQACDMSEPEAVQALLKKAGVEHVDCALVDAPCSGLGTLRRHPELKRRRRRDLASLTRLQDRILNAVAPTIRPGGTLVYAVCTITRAEGPERVQHFLREHDDFVVEAPGEAFEAYLEPGTPFVQTWTDRDRMDGFFAARLRRLS